MFTTSLPLPPDVDPDRYSLVPQLAVLLSRLARLQDRKQLAFAVACCQHLYPFYAAHPAPARDNLLPAILPRLWLQVTADAQLATDAGPLRASLLEMALGDDTLETHWPAVLAVASVYATLAFCQSPSVHHAVSAAECVLDLADHRVTNKLCEAHPVVFEADQREREAIIAAHPLTRQADQTIDRYLFLASSDLTIDALVARLKAEASAA